MIVEQDEDSVTEHQLQSTAASFSVRKIASRFSRDAQQKRRNVAAGFQLIDSKFGVSLFLNFFCK